MPLVSTLEAIGAARSAPAGGGGFATDKDLGRGDLVAVEGCRKDGPGACQHPNQWNSALALRGMHSYRQPVGSYGRLFRTPGVKGLYATTLLARFPAGINAIAVLLFFRSEGSTFAESGAIVAGLGLGLAIGSPATSRLYDRKGLIVLKALASAHATGLGLLVVLGLIGAPAILVVIIAFSVGIALPPVVPVFRAAAGAILRDRSELLSTAYAVESMALELIFVGGPAIAAGFLILGTPALPVVVSALTGVIGTLWFAKLLERRSTLVLTDVDTT